MIAIVGGGLAGLVAAYELTRAGHAVTVLEGTRRLGGQVWTELVDGFLIEHGAEGYAAARESAFSLVADLQLTDRLVSQITTFSMVSRGGRLQPVPVAEAARLAGIQADRVDFGHGIASFQEGTGELVSALSAALARRATILRGAPVSRLAPGTGGWHLTTGKGGALDAEAVILAIPAAAAARLLAPVSRDAAEMLESFQAVSSVSVSLACPAAAVKLPPGVGGLVAAGDAEQEGFRACDFSSAKFPGRAPSGSVLLRAFFRPGPGSPADAPDDHWVELAVDAVWPALEIQEPPARTWVARWLGALPRYAADHGETVQAVRGLLASGPPLELAGAAYRAAGVAGAIESGRAAARALAGRAA